MRRWWRETMLARRRAGAVWDARIRVAQADLDYWRRMADSMEVELRRQQETIDRLRTDALTLQREIPHA